MKLAVMQPYLFPYIGYFQLINYADKWVVFDDTQFISKGWVNRNRILHPDLEKEWQYFSVPLKKHSRESRIKDIEINENTKWKADFLGKLTSYKRKSPFYSEVIDLIEDSISFKCSSMSELAVHSLKNTCDYLDIPFNYSIFSEMEINTDNIEHAGQWALKIADAMGADEYVNPSGGTALFNESEFLEKDIELRFLKPNLTSYIQRRGSFVSGLSIIDVMMWNDKDKIREMLTDYDVFSSANLMALGE